MQSAGFSLGASSVGVVMLRREATGITVLHAEARVHDGDPILASRECYRELDARLQVPVRIVGVGVTGSGRQIAGLHAMTDGVVNEIIAHAAAAVHFDPEVDTIIEIGGQDAKYTLRCPSSPSRAMGVPFPR